MSRLPVFALLVACSSPATPPPVLPAPPPVQPDVEPVKPVAQPEPPKVEDAHLWLEEVMADKALAWAKDRNAKTKDELEAVTTFASSKDRIRAILDTKDKIPYVWKQGPHYYNLWKDAANPRGLLRRTTLAEYKKAQPKWETVLDVDALGAKEGQSWVYKGFACLYPKYDRCLVGLSPGGGDATAYREFDSAKKTFIAGGFEVPAAKTRISWKDKDAVYIGTDFGPGSMTASGYPRTVREWKRGTKLADAPVIFEGKESDVSVGGSRTWDNGKPIDIMHRGITTYSSEMSLRDEAGKLIKIEKQPDASVGMWNGQFLFRLRSDWTQGDKTYPRGTALIIPRADFLAGKHNFTQLFEPAANRSLASITELKTALVVNEIEDIKNKIYVWKQERGTWKRTAFGKDGLGTTSVSAVEPYSGSDDYWLNHTDFLTPSSLSLGKLGGKPAIIKQSPTLFDAKGLTVAQHFATSKDGTKVPYFQVSRESLALDGNNATVLYGYGGFEISQLPSYSAVAGAMWEERGGVWVVANIRGGGEYGPAWHQAAKGHNRQKSYDDFIAIAEDLIKRKVTSPSKLGILGGSNGGLLTGVMLTQRPDLFGAVVSAVPLLDMKRYHKLLAGASWMEEYGNPEKSEDWAVIQKYSPYHNVHAGKKYPRTLFTTSTRDDRVHPGHARKMVARMLEQGHDILYYENLEGGHAGAADNEQAAFMQALQYTFFAKQLGLR
jgi:prolyl oligopeptidase